MSKNLASTQPPDSPPIPLVVSLPQLYHAWRAVRRHKKPSNSQMAFERCWIDGLTGLGQILRAGKWWPRRAVCFTVNRPKLREIHAPAFADRIVHHLLVPKLEAIFEPRFIFDSFANRRGKGIHAAVRRLQGFIRQVLDGPGAGKGWYLQLDIRDFFYSIHRPSLYLLLKTELQKRAALEPPMAKTYLAWQSLCHRLLLRPTQSHDRPSKAREHLPPRKQLRFAAKGCGLPIGNLSSQFFANVYLNELDQFVKHELKAKRYLRYVDDFILVSADRDELERWHQAIEAFLQQRLRLSLKPATVQPLANGIDFLGYVSFAHHRVVRKRVVGHAREKLWHWQRAHVQNDGQAWHIKADVPALQRLRACIASYFGHFGHADSYRLRGRLLEQFPWLAVLFDQGAWKNGCLLPRWQQMQALGLQDQLQQLRRQYPQAWLAARCGLRVWVAVPANSPRRRERLLRHIPPAIWVRKREKLQQAGQTWLELDETGHTRCGRRIRSVTHWYVGLKEICHE